MRIKTKIMQILTISVLILSTLTLVFNLESVSGEVDPGLGSNIFQALIQVSAPIESELRGNTPIIVKLADLAAGLPSTIDPFGFNTLTTEDDVKWEATFVYYDGSLIPSHENFDEFLPVNVQVFINDIEIPVTHYTEIIWEDEHPYRWLFYASFEPSYFMPGDPYNLRVGCSDRNGIVWEVEELLTILPDL
jgi:hypothetical protein